MLIRPKRIYNFCLFHAYIGDIATCFATLSYLLQHIWTNLLTQYLSASFCMLLSVHCRKMPIIKVLGKIRKTHIKNQQFRSFRKTEGERRGATPSQAASPTPRRPPGTARTEAAPGTRLVRWGLPPSSPSAYLFIYLRKPSEGPPLRDLPYCSTAGAISISGSPGEAVPAPCRREDWPPEASPSPWSPPGCAVSSPPWTMGP